MAEPGRHAWIDAGAGIAGDMLLGALVDAGAPVSMVQDAVDAFAPDAVRVTAREVTRAGQRATKVDVAPVAADQPHRRWSDIRDLIDRAPLEPAVAASAQRVFETLAAAEGRVHGVEATQVHFHEVGAWDSIADVVGVCAALHWHAVRSVSAGPIAVGSGRVTGAHGDLPVPVPAVLELGTGWELRAGGTGELATPTGVALVRALAATCEPLPPMRVRAVGVGAGSRDTPGRANVVRVCIGERTETAGQPATEQLWVLEANVDDLDPRVWPTVLTALLEAGAADAWLTPILMKKGRPAHTLSVLCAGGDRSRMGDLVHSLTSTFGSRSYAVDRVALQRDWRIVQVHGHSVRIKMSLDGSGRIVHATPEFEDAATAARAVGLPVRRLLDDTAATATAQGLRAGSLLPPIDS
ncbi:nickel pincer cofactor biosynthesis protein LarC [Allobranchiibius sp. GilTou38]|uniref:nickel pincer cofactor biosynthesis protein LarC n=1 Tax=Allobranchiibius sp. GilTou38 TaxID=2815210 RepID=UPI003260056A